MPESGDHVRRAKRHEPAVDTAILALCVALLLAVVAPPNALGDPYDPSAGPQETSSPGERMYREGLLQSGEPMTAIVKGDIAVPGTAFTCVSCHLRSGLGSLEGTVYTPPTTGPWLFKPFKGYELPTYETQPFVPKPIVDYNAQFHQRPPARPVYTDKTLADLLRTGIDPAGRPMKDIMPCYDLSDQDMDHLICYLKTLSAEVPPGISDNTIRFATIVADDVPAELRNAMLVPLENYFRHANEMNFSDPGVKGLRRSTGSRSRLMLDATFMSRGVAVRKLALSRWVLTGPHETWRAQLEEYYRKEPVFALVGGLTGGECHPVHQFCRENGIPHLFPMTDFPVISRTDWYTLYFSKGYYQEGEGAARYLNGIEAMRGKPIVEVVRDSPEGRALSRGFQETWREFGHEPAVTVTLAAGEPLTADLLLRGAGGEKPAAVIAWDGPEALKALEAVAAGTVKPAMVLVSSSYLGKSMFSLDERARDFTYLTYPYGITQPLRTNLAEPGPPASMGRKIFNAEANTAAATRIWQQTYILTSILNAALLDMKGNYYRDNLLDVIDAMMDQDMPLYERLSFGPGQRYASKGCFIVQLGKGPTPALVKKSAWVIH